MTDNMIFKREIEQAIASLARPDIVVQYVPDDVPWGKKIAVYKKDEVNAPNKELFTISSRTVYDALVAVRNFRMEYNGKKVRIETDREWKKAYKLYTACKLMVDGVIVDAKLFYIFPNLVKVKTRMFFDKLFCKNQGR